MRYENVREARFIERPNRFIALCRVGEEEVVAHVKNTGRCKELLTPSAKVFLERRPEGPRKTAWDLIAVEKPIKDGSLLINMDSAAPNAAAREWLAAGGMGALTGLRAEYTLGGSRFDFYALKEGRPLLIEVKGCTLEEEGVAYFPDAPTLRGLRHVQEMEKLARQGYLCALLFVIQMKGPSLFMPNDATHPAFGAALAEAARAGVEIRAVDCLVTPDSMTIDAPVRVTLPL